MRVNLPHAQETMQSLPPGWVARGRPTQSSAAFRTVGRLMRRPAAVLACLLAAFAATACGPAGPSKTGTGSSDKPRLGVKGTAPEASHDLGFPALATKNTTRIPGADAIANAAGVAAARLPPPRPG